MPNKRGQKGELVSIEAVATDELTHDACGRDFIVNVCFKNIVKNLNDCSNLVIALVGGVNDGEQGEDVLFENCELIES